MMHHLATIGTAALLAGPSPPQGAGPQFPVLPLESYLNGFFMGQLNLTDGSSYYLMGNQWIAQQYSAINGNMRNYASRITIDPISFSWQPDLESVVSFNEVNQAYNSSSGYVMTDWTFGQSAGQPRCHPMETPSFLLPPRDYLHKNAAFVKNETSTDGRTLSVYYLPGWGSPYISAQVLIVDWSASVTPAKPNDPQFIVAVTTLQPAGSWGPSVQSAVLNTVNTYGMGDNSGAMPFRGIVAEPLVCSQQ
jgi:hypothetical protein